MRTPFKAREEKPKMASGGKAAQARGNLKISKRNTEFIAQRLQVVYHSFQ